jgi:GNAT superfamily N-acetyltransferase
VHVAVLDTAIHDREGFRCGVESLDRYIRERAASDVKKAVAICYVLFSDDDPSTIRGFYTLSNFNIELSGLPDTIRKRLPKYPMVPATLIGRFAIGKEHRGKGFGEWLLFDALRRALQTSHVIGSAAIVIDAKDERGMAFYEKYGFQSFSADRLRLFMPMGTVAQLF